MKNIVSQALVTVLVASALSVSAYAQTRGSASKAASADTGDFVEGNLKFHRMTGGFIQVIDVTKNVSAGMVILPQGGAPVFAPMPGYDIQSAYEKHMKGGAASAPTPATQTTSAGTTMASANQPAPAAAPANANQAAPAAAPAPGFDAASKTVTFADGRSVTFVDDTHMEVKLLGITGAQTYKLEYHGSGGLRVARNLANTKRGYVGQSISGTGVAITLESANGMPGGQLYDTADGANIPATVMPRVKPIVAAVREATDAVKTSQPDLAKLKVVKSLLSNNMGM
jgi:hypothetical protein